MMETVEGGKQVKKTVVQGNAVVWQIPGPSCQHAEGLLNARYVGFTKMNRGRASAGQAYASFRRG
jgi:hypothetical protein